MNEPFAHLPSSWRLSRLDRVASVNARIGWKALTADEYQPDGYAFLATPNIKGGQIDFDHVNYISRYRYEESPELKLAVGNVLLVKDGNTLGITNLVRDLPRPATVNGSIAVLQAFGVYPDFLRYVLASEPSQGRISMMKGGMGVPHLFQWDIKRFPVPLPPFDGQKRIAKFLDNETARIDALITKKDRMVEVLETSVNAYIERMLCNGSESSIPLRRLLTIMPQYGASESGELGEESWPRYIRITDVNPDGSLHNDDIRRLPPMTAHPYLLKDNDILIARSGATVGKSFEYYSELTRVF